MNAAPEPGRFPYTVDLYQPVVDPEPDDYGHQQTTYTLRFQSAARVWTTSTAGASRDAGELVVHTPRLELLQPTAGIEVGWRLIWRGRLWNIDATEERGFNLIVTLSAA